MLFKCQLVSSWFPRNSFVLLIPLASAASLGGSVPLFPRPRKAVIELSLSFAFTVELTEHFASVCHDSLSLVMVFTSTSIVLQKLLSSPSWQIMKIKSIQLHDTSPTGRPDSSAALGVSYQAPLSSSLTWLSLSRASALEDVECWSLVSTLW